MDKKYAEQDEMTCPDCKGTDILIQVTGWLPVTVTAMEEEHGPDESIDWDAKLEDGEVTEDSLSFASTLYRCADCGAEFSLEDFLNPEETAEAASSEKGGE